MTSRIGLALSGGGARGLAHIGVLKVLEQEGIVIDCMAGTSMGGFVAAAYATGLAPTLLEEEALRMSKPRHLLSLVDPAPPRRGLFEGGRVRRYLARYLGNCAFDDLRVPLTLIAVDLNTGQQVHLNQGSVADAVRATIAIPGIFAPVERDGQLLVDGGVLNNLPADVARDMGADLVIAVDVTMGAEAAGRSVTEQRSRHTKVSGALGSTAIWYRSLRVMMIEINRHRMEQARPQVYIQPAIPPSVGALTGFAHAAEVVAAGEQAAREALPHILSLLASPAALQAEG